MMGAEVCHPSQHECCPLMPDHDVLVEQYVQTQAPEFRCPGRLAGVVLVIAGDHVRTISGTQSSEGLDVRRKVTHRTVDEITGHSHEIRTETVYRVNNGIDIIPLDSDIFTFWDVS